MSETKPKPAHRKFRLDPPHGERFIYWVAVGRIPGDSRTEHIRADRKWFLHVRKYGGDLQERSDYSYSKIMGVEA